MHTFTNDWFANNIPIWQKILAPWKGLPQQAIEIGCFEGQASCWLLENILTHPESKLVCVDIFKSNEELKHMPFGEVKQRFLDNTKEFGSKIELVEQDSSLYMKNRWQMADIIYVDGSHLCKDALIDGVQAHLLLKPKGIIIFDDYLWNGLETFPMVPKQAIDAFMTCFATEYDVRVISQQVILQKK